MDREYIDDLLCEFLAQVYSDCGQLDMAEMQTLETALSDFLDHWRMTLADSQRN